MDAKDKLLNQIANHLILHSWELNDVSLFYGKMGIVLFFAHYARYTGKNIYDDFAGELLENVIENISDTLPIDLGRGLCGIGWGIEYLIQNGFMDAESDDILDEIDQRVMERDLLRVKDLSLETGISGILTYVFMRLKINDLFVNFRINCFDKKYVTICRNIGDQIEMKLMGNLLLNIVAFNNCDKEDYFMNLGLINGCSGLGIKCIL